MQGEAHLQRFYHERRVAVAVCSSTARPGSVHRVLYPHLASGQLLRQDKENAQLGLHTLLLLDIRVKEPSVEALCRGKKEYEPLDLCPVQRARGRCSRWRRREERRCAGQTACALRWRGWDRTTR